MADLRPFLAAAAALALAGCGQEQAGGEDAADPAEGSQVSCAIGGASEMTRNCTVERSVEDGALVLVIRHEDGGFRRLRVMTDGSGVITADGADPATITLFDGEIEVAVAGDRYVLPATIAGDGPAPVEAGDAQQ